MDLEIAAILALDGIANGAIYVLVALIWVVPDRRIERSLSEMKDNPS